MDGCECKLLTIFLLAYLFAWLDVNGEGGKKRERERGKKLEKGETKKFTYLPRLLR